jgi:CDGSH-type Zn-finger protein
MVESAESASSGAATVVACPDGPLLVRGSFTVVDQSGEPVPRKRATVALCRCGGTAIAPWCDGTHKVNGYRSDG